MSEPSRCSYLERSLRLLAVPISALFLLSQCIPLVDLRLGQLRGRRFRHFVCRFTNKPSLKLDRTSSHAWGLEACSAGWCRGCV